MLNRIAQVLDLSPDYLLNGTVEDRADTQIKDVELLNQFTQIEEMPEDKKRLLKEFIDAFIFKSIVVSLSQ